jgi:hypothetical protein
MHFRRGGGPGATLTAFALDLDPLTSTASGVKEDASSPRPRTAPDRSAGPAGDLLRHPALADQPEAARQLPDGADLGLRDRRPFPRPDADLGALRRVEGVLLRRYLGEFCLCSELNKDPGTAFWTLLGHAVRG